jgi:hypothetical protein
VRRTKILTEADVLEELLEAVVDAELILVLDVTGSVVELVTAGVLVVDVDGSVDELVTAGVLVVDVGGSVDELVAAGVLVVDVGESVDDELVAAGVLEVGAPVVESVIWPLDK